MKILQPNFTGSIMFVVFVAMWVFGIYQWLILPLMGAFFLLMIAILESKQDRIMKGTSLILFGIGFGIFLPEALVPTPEFAKGFPKDLIENLEIFRNLVVFSCSGAGGSIIAGHAERFLSDFDLVEPQAQDKTQFDYPQDIRAIHGELAKVKRYFVYFTGALTVMLMLILAAVLT